MNLKIPIFTGENPGLSGRRDGSPVPAPIVVSLPDGSVEMRFVVRVPPREDISSTMTFERNVRSATARIGLALMEYGPAAFDTECEIAHGGGSAPDFKGRQTETCQTSSGALAISRHVHQPAAGGKTYVPLEDRARIIGLSTPLFAGSIAAKYSGSGGRAVQRDLREHQPGKCPWPSFRLWRRRPPKWPWTGRSAGAARL